MQSQAFFPALAWWRKATQFAGLSADFFQKRSRLWDDIRRANICALRGIQHRSRVSD
jgi:hypothetical protein